MRNKALMNFVDYVLVWLSYREETNKIDVIGIREDIIYDGFSVPLLGALGIMSSEKIMISKGDYQVFKKYTEDLSYLKKECVDYLDNLVDYSIEEIQIFKHQAFSSYN